MFMTAHATKPPSLNKLKSPETDFKARPAEFFRQNSGNFFPPQEQFVLNLGAGVQKNRFLRKLQFKVSPAQKIRQSRLKLVLRASLAGLGNKWTFQKILYAFE